MAISSPLGKTNDASAVTGSTGTTNDVVNVTVPRHFRKGFESVECRLRVLLVVSTFRK
jgi:hypothetical protein